MISKGMEKFGMAQSCSTCPSPFHICVCSCHRLSGFDESTDPTRKSCRNMGLCAGNLKTNEKILNQLTTALLVTRQIHKQEKNPIRKTKKN